MGQEKGEGQGVYTQHTGKNKLTPAGGRHTTQDRQPQVKTPPRGRDPEWSPRPGCVQTQAGHPDKTARVCPEGGPQNWRSEVENGV